MKNEDIPALIRELRQRLDLTRCVLLIIFPLNLLGCGILGIGSHEQCPEVWVIPVQKIRFEGMLTPDDDRIDRIKDFLRDMNRLLYDVTDGQVRIARFELYNADGIASTTPGVGTMREIRANKGLGIVGRPKSPGYFQFSLHEHILERPYCLGVAVHEWLHAWIGLRDEYEEADADRSHCPKEWVQRMQTDSCIMDSCWRTELCRTENHNPDTEQGTKNGMSCYEWLKKVVEEAGIGKVEIPSKVYVGPNDPPTPQIDLILNKK